MKLIFIIEELCFFVFVFSYIASDIGPISSNGYAASHEDIHFVQWDFDSPVFCKIKQQPNLILASNCLHLSQK